MKSTFYNNLRNTLEQLESNGTYKYLRHLTDPMKGTVNIEDFPNSIVMCSNNYIGLSNNEFIKTEAKKSIEHYGLGASSVRFICGTFDIHRQLEQTLAKFLNMESSLTYTSCWSANTAVIPAILNAGDTVISDELNHASIIDGCRLVGKSVNKKVYKHSDMSSLEEQLIASKNSEVVLVVTDGVFSMEGDIAVLPEIIKLTDKYGALLMVDDSHSTGVIGATGRGTMEYYNITTGVDIISGTFGKALGGAGGGFIAGSKDLCELLIQKSRPHLFSNSLPPVLSSIALNAIKYLDENPNIVTSLMKKTSYARKKIKEAGLNPLDGDSAIIPLIVGPTSTAIKAANMMMEKGLYTTGFGFPVVPEGEARVRLQISDSLTYDELDRAIKIIIETMKELE